MKLKDRRREGLELPISSGVTELLTAVSRSRKRQYVAGRFAAHHGTDQAIVDHYTSNSCFCPISTVLMSGGSGAVESWDRMRDILVQFWGFSNNDLIDIQDIFNRFDVLALAPLKEAYDTYKQDFRILDGKDARRLFNQAAEQYYSPSLPVIPWTNSFGLYGTHDEAIT